MTYLAKPFLYATGAILFSYSALAATLVPVVTGGVGETGQQAIERVQGQYNVKLVFTGEGGMYLSDVAVSIRDHEGLEVLNGVTQGPMLLAELPPGHYTVEAKTELFNKKRDINVGKKINTYQITFPVKDNAEVSSRDELEENGFEVMMSFPG